MLEITLMVTDHNSSLAHAVCNDDPVETDDIAMIIVVEPNQSSMPQYVPFNLEALVLHAVRDTLLRGPLTWWQILKLKMLGLPHITKHTEMRELAFNGKSYVYLLHCIAELLESVSIVNAHVNITALRRCKTVGQICMYVGDIVARHLVGGPTPSKYPKVD